MAQPEAGIHTKQQHDRQMNGIDNDNDPIHRRQYKQFQHEWKILSHSQPLAQCP
jgi:hypothetical protein